MSAVTGQGAVCVAGTGHGAADYGYDGLGWRIEVDTAGKVKIPMDFEEICLGNTLSHGISPQRFFTQEATIWCPAKLWSGLAGHGASLTVMKGGEYWLHTEEQLAFLDDWVKKDFLSIA